MAEGKPRNPKSPTKEVSDSDTSEEEQVNPRHKTSTEEREYSTIPGHSRAQAHCRIRTCSQSKN